MVENTVLMDSGLALWPLTTPAGECGCQSSTYNVSSRLMFEGLFPYLWGYVKGCGAFMRSDLAYRHGSL